MAELEFEWDDDKNAINVSKHGIDFREAARVFNDPLVLLKSDDNWDEDRWNALGYVDGRVLRVTYTIRGTVYRIISARPALRHERREYHEA